MRKLILLVCFVVVPLCLFCIYFLFYKTDYPWVTVDRCREFKVKCAQIKIGELANALEAYRQDCGNYPSETQSLAALLEKPTKLPLCPEFPSEPYIKSREMLVDPWGNEFKYEIKNERPLIVSYGKDGVMGGEGLDRDLTSEDL